MSRVRVRNFQTVKSVGYLSKVCSGFVKEISSLSSAATDVSYGFRNTNEFPDTSETSSEYSKYPSFRESKSGYIYGESSRGSQRNPSEAYGQSYSQHNVNSYYSDNSSSNQQISVVNHQYNVNGSESYSQHNFNSYYSGNASSNQQIGAVNHQYNVNGSEIYSQHNINSYYSGNASSNQQISEVNHQYNVNGYECYSQHNVNSYYTGNASSSQQISEVNHQYNVNGSESGELIPQNSDEAVVERQLLGTLKELDDFCKDGKLKEAVEVLGLLEQNYVSVDIPRYLLLMEACGESQALTEAKHVHNHLTWSIPHFDVYISNKILEMYSKCGSMEDAYKVFDKMPQRNLTSWDTMITGLAKNGHGEDAIEMFTEFKRIGLKPDHEMFHGVFTACSVLGDMREGLLHFESMTKTYNLVPSMEHYASVIDMLGSAGHLNEALEFIEKMPMEPSVEIWVIMMKQSRVQGDLELGNRFAEMVNILDPNRLDKQSKEGLVPLKASDKANGKEKKKSSGNNLLSFPPNAYEFRSGDISHPDCEKIYSQLRRLNQHMKEAGFVPETRVALHDLDQESKEEALLSHSERIALSQALLTSPVRAPIRIIKNLRVCLDCHNALKVISGVVGRLIIARDVKRWHHFENGKCSCGDYW